MKNTKICESCNFWDRGDCENPKVQQRTKTYDHAVSYSKDFGCVFWETNEKEYYANGCSKREKGMTPQEVDILFAQVKPPRKLPTGKGKPLRIVRDNKKNQI